MSHVVCLLADARRALGNDPGHRSRASAQELAARARLRDPLRAQIASARRVCRRDPRHAMHWCRLSNRHSRAPLVRQGGWSPGLGPLRWRCTSNSVAAAHDLQGVLVLDGKLEQWACPDVFHCRRRIPSQSHPSSKPAALCSPVQCNMQRCAARTISAHSSRPDACVRL